MHCNSFHTCVSHLLCNCFGLNLVYWFWDNADFGAFSKAFVNLSGIRGLLRVRIENDCLTGSHGEGTKFRGDKN